MRVLFLGGTGLISSACAELAAASGIELFLLTRGRSVNYTAPEGARLIAADVQGDPGALAAVLAGQRFDAVVDWIAFTPADIERDLSLFGGGRTRQFVFISSASVYRRPPDHYLITEETPRANPYWEYARDKIACEERLLRAYREEGFPVTIVRPSLTYGLSQIPFAVGSWRYPYTIIRRMRQGRKVIVPGDGTSLWTMTWNGDFARGLVGLLGSAPAVGEAFHITADEVLTWNQIYLEAGRAAGVETQLVHIPSDLIAAYYPHAWGNLLGDKANSVVLDNSKIKRFVPGFSATVCWAEGVRRALAWHEADPARRAVDEEADRLWDRIIAAYEGAFPGKTADA